MKCYFNRLNRCRHVDYRCAEQDPQTYRYPLRRGPGRHDRGIRPAEWMATSADSLRATPTRPNPSCLKARPTSGDSSVRCKNRVSFLIEPCLTILGRPPRRDQCILSRSHRSRLTSKSGLQNRALASDRRIRQPPEKALVGLERSS